MGGKESLATGGLCFSSCTFHFHQCKATARVGGAVRGKSLHRFVLRVFSLFCLCLLRSVQPTRATHSHMTLVSVFRICREGIAAVTARQFPKSTQQGKHLACDAPKSETSSSLNTSLLATRNLSFESSCSITHQESPVLGRHPPTPRTVMWFLVQEQKQQCQDSYSCLSCILVQ